VNTIVHFLLTVIFACAVTLYAQEDALVSSLKEKYGEKTSLELTFDLDIYWKVREKHEKKSGDLKIAPGDKFRLTLGTWEWVCDGHTYWQYNKSTGQVIVKNLLDIDLALHPSQMMKTYLSYNFTVTSADDREAVLDWRMPEGERKKAAYAAISMVIDKKKTIIKKIIAMDTNGNESTYTFAGTKTGTNIPPETFTFTVPKGVEVVDTRD
jgi:outer membrane lipoprotein carrier protein